MIAQRSHAEAFQMVPEAEVVAVADVDRERAKALAEKYGIPQVFSSYEELLARGGVDAVSVALPVFLHAPATIAGAGSRQARPLREADGEVQR